MSPNTKPQEPDWKTAPLFGRRDPLLYTSRRSYQLCRKAPVIVEIGTSRDERPEACDGDGWSTRVWGWLAKETGGKSYTVDIDPEAIEACGRITAEQAEGIEYIVSDSLEFLQKWNAEERGRIDLLYLDGLDYNGGTTLREGTVRSAHGNKGNQGNADTGEGERVGADYVAEGRRSPSQAEDFIPTARGRSAAELSENHHLAASELALPHMAERCLVLFDDTYPPSEPLSPFSPLVGEGGRGDEGFQFAGKGARAIPFFLENGFSVEFVCGGQVLLSRGAEDTPADIFEDKVSNLVTQRLQAYARRRWLAMPALVTIGQGYREFEATAEAQVYLDAVARLCGSNGTAIEIVPTSAYAQTYLARRGVCASGIMLDGDHIERARQAAYWLGCCADYGHAGLFTLNADISRRDAETQRVSEILGHKNTQKLQNDAEEPNIESEHFPNAQRSTPNAYSVIHHSNLAAALPTPWLLAMLTQQVAIANWVVFSLDSAFAAQDGELDETGCRRLTPEMWQELLSDFEIGDLRTYGPTGKERVLITLRGQPLRSSVSDSDSDTDKPTPPGLGAGGPSLSVSESESGMPGTQLPHPDPLLTARAGFPCAPRSGKSAGGLGEGATTEPQTASQMPAHFASPTFPRTLGGEEHVGPSPIRTHETPRSKHLNTAKLTPLLDPFPFGISLIIHTRNEAHQIIDCIRSADGLADEIIVCDMESNDGTPDVVVKYAGDISTLPVSSSSRPPVRVLRHPYIPNFDSARNPAAMFARYRFVFYLDADERLPPGLAARLRHLLATQGHMFEALTLPFRNMFCGKELNCIYGYKAASIYKNGYFFYNARPHQGARIDGRVVNFPADDQNMALLHLTYPNIPEYIRKMDGYSSTEAANMKIDRREFHWQEMLAHSVQDMVGYELRGALKNDGPHGLIWTLCSCFYRIAQYGKHWQARYESGAASAQEASCPGSLEEVLEFALHIVRQAKAEIQSRAKTRSREEMQEKPLEQKIRNEEIQKQENPLTQKTRNEGGKETGHISATGVSRISGIQSPNTSLESPLRVFASSREMNSPASVCWFGPANDPSGYGEEVRSFLFACDRAGIDVALRAVAWGNDQVILAGEKAERMRQLLERPVSPGYIQIIQNFPEGFVRDPNASIVIGRTMFEVDRVPVEHVRACNRLDYIWVPSEWAKDVYRKSGVAAEKLVVAPGCFDASEFINHKKTQIRSRKNAQKA